MWRRFRLCSLVWLVLIGACGAGEAEVSEARGVERVILIGLDGLSSQILETMMAAGALPNFEALRQRGTGGRLKTLLPTYSPNIWASVATGKLPNQHGIKGFVHTVEDRRVPYTSNSLRVRPLWDIVGEHGYRVAVVGWWTTWPAVPVNGVLVSDRMLYNRFNLWLGLAHHGSDLPRQTHPPELMEQLAETTRIPDGLEREFLARFAPKRASGPIERSLHDPWYELFLVYARDRAYLRMLDRVLEDGPFGLVAFYLNGIDIASHYFWKYRYPEEWHEPIAASELAEHRGVIERYYRYVDEQLASVLALADEHTVVLVVSDHGFQTGRRRDSNAISGTHYNTAPDGVALLAGGNVQAGTDPTRGSVLDITPTVLHLLGLPVARDMDGEVLGAVHSAMPEITWVDSHERKGLVPDSDPMPSEHDEAIVQKLKALGYIED